MAEPLRAYPRSTEPELPPENTGAAYGSFSDRVTIRAGRAYRDAQHGIASAVVKVRRGLRCLTAERPKQLIIGIAVVSFLAGVGLRIWRSRHD